MNHLLIKAKVLEFLAHSLQKIWPEVVDQRIEGILDVINRGSESFYYGLL